MAGKRYYWLKLQDDFFDSKRIKKLRRLAGGDTYTIIYLKMQLVAMKHDGILEYTGLESTFAAELALDLNEEPDDVAVTIQYLLSCGLMESSDDREYFLPYSVENVGSETSAAKRMRDSRSRKALAECNNVTPALQTCYGEKRREDIETREREEPDARACAREAADEKSPLGRVMSFYLDKINATPSTTSVELLQGYLDVLDADVIIHAMEAALDEQKPTWPYIQGILRRYERERLTTMSAVLESERRHRERKEGEHNGAGTAGAATGNNGNARSTWNIHSDLDD